MYKGEQNQPERRGMFITFEGGDGAGKSTHLQLVAEALRERGQEVVCLREPGGTIIGEQLRSTVLDPGNYIMTDECELLIYEAARAQLVAQIIRPALARGSIVLCDRFTDSTIAYQSFGRGLERAFVERANNFACQGIHPDRTILMITGGDAEVGIERATQVSPRLQRKIPHASAWSSRTNRKPEQLRRCSPPCRICSSGWRMVPYATRTSSRCFS